MPEKCEQSSCRALAKLEQEVSDLRTRNGSDHKEFRENIQRIERDEARQEAKLDNITSSISDLKSDNKEVITKLNSIATRAEQINDNEEDVKALKADMKELKEKPAKRWDGIVEKIIGLVVAAVVGMMLARLGL